MRSPLTMTAFRLGKLRYAILLKIYSEKSTLNLRQEYAQVGAIPTSRPPGREHAPESSALSRYSPANMPSNHRHPHSQINSHVPDAMQALQYSIHKFNWTHIANNLTNVQLHAHVVGGVNQDSESDRGDGIPMKNCLQIVTIIGVLSIGLWTLAGSQIID